MMVPQFMPTDKKAPSLESDSFLTLAFQKMLVPLHKNIGEFEILLCTPVYFYNYNAEVGQFYLDGLRVLIATDQNFIVCFTVNMEDWVMPLFWEQEEKHFQEETVRRLDEKRLRSRKYISIENQRRERDELNRLHSQFKSELEIEKARQDKK